MDNLDMAILNHVQRDARVRQADIARAEGASVSTVNDRLRRLQEQGIITGSHARLDPGKVGLNVCAFVQVLISSPSAEEPFVARVGKLDAVQECHCITGDFSYLLKVRVSIPQNLELFLRDQIKPMPGVVRTNTLMVLSTSKETQSLPLDSLPVGT